jgi:hypothetical protein
MLAGSLALVAGCSGGAARLPPSATIIDVRMTEYHFAVRSTAPAGRAIFRIVNAGGLDHNLTLEKLPRDFPPLDLQLHSSIRRGAPAVAIVPTLHPGDTATFAADVSRGRYGLLSSVMGDDGVPDLLKGMNAEIRVR